jgi:hypothetical protein
MMRGTLGALVIAVFVCSGACTSSKDAGSSNDAGPAGTGNTNNQTVGTSGGTVEGSGATVTVPQGALANDTSISVASSKEATPSGAAAYSPVFVFGPDGTNFAIPVTVKLPFTGDASKAAIFWSKADGMFEKLSTTAAGGTATAQVSHFSKGFVGDGTVSFPTLAGGGGETEPCPIGSWSQNVTGTAACDGGTGTMTLTIAQGSGTTLLATQELVNVKSGLGCGYKVDGTATYEGNALKLDLAVNDNNCTKHWLSTWTVDSACATMSTPDGALTITNCQACATTGECSGCGSASCTVKYGAGTLTKK